MCGIAGIASFSEPISASYLDKMARSIAHRGPDDQGIHIASEILPNGCTYHVGLAHRRLSIIDLSSDGHQPMPNEDSTIWIVYNGEFYNFQDFDPSLKAKGHLYRSRTDTETIIHLYEEIGASCFEQMNGMWSLSIWDKRHNTLLLSRDRVGKKPLYYYADGNRFLFASEMKAILEDKTIPRSIDQVSLLNYITYGYITSPRTIFKDIYKLKPGHYIYLDLNHLDAFRRVKQIPYWKIPSSLDFDLSEEEAIRTLRDLLVDAVRLRLVSDAPLGAFLSGGIDSSIIVGIMSTLMERPVKTFSIGFAEKQYNETHYASIVARYYKTEHSEELVKPDALGLLPKLAWQYDEPFGDSSAVPTYYVSKLARKDVKVVLSGDGGDELFGGYIRYSYLKEFQGYDKIPSLLKKVCRTIATHLPDGLRGKWRIEQLGIDSNARYFNAISQISTKMMRQLVRNTSLEQFLPLKSPDFHACEGDGISSLMRYDMNHYLPDDILMKVDKASMLNSLEVRAPLLDYRIIELAARMPLAYKINAFGVRKYILKKAFRSMLPKELDIERKQGFAMPIKPWFKREMVNYIRHTILASESYCQSMFNRSAVANIVEQACSPNSIDYSPLIWNLLFFEHWCKRYIGTSE